MAYLFLIGLFVGILFVNLGHDTWIRNGSLLGAEMMNRLKSSRPAGEGLVGYILGHRLFTGCLLCLVSTTLIGMPLLCAYICYAGLSAGCLLSVAVVRYGIRGLLFYGRHLISAGHPADTGLYLSLSLGGGRQSDALCAAYTAGRI